MCIASGGLALSLRRTQWLPGLSFVPWTAVAQGISTMLSITHFKSTSTSHTLSYISISNHTSLVFSWPSSFLAQTARNRCFLASITGPKHLPHIQKPTQIYLGWWSQSLDPTLRRCFRRRVSGSLSWGNIPSGWESDREQSSSVLQNAWTI